MKIFLHIGHGKTGSSYIQSSLALSQDALADRGLWYPTFHTFEQAKLGNISSGNIVPNDTWCEYVREQAGKSSCENILFSNEQLFHVIHGDMETFGQLCSDFEVCVILFTRNPVAHLLSAYGQGVKRGGLVDSFDVYSTRYQTVRRVEGMIRQVTALNAELIIRNYSNHLDTLLEVFIDALGISGASPLVEPPNRQVNRSLTRSELFVQQCFNRHYGQDSGRFVSDVFGNRLPEIASQAPAISPDIYATFARRMEKDIHSANKLIDHEEHYATEPFPGEEQKESDLHFSESQIDVLVESLSSELSRYAGLDEHVDMLRDVAILLEKHPDFNLVQAKNLMELAHRIRPTGQLIKDKLQEYESRIDSNTR